MQANTTTINPAAYTRFDEFDSFAASFSLAKTAILELLIGGAGFDFYNTEAGKLDTDKLDADARDVVIFWDDTNREVLQHALSPSGYEMEDYLASWADRGITVQVLYIDTEDEEFMAELMAAIDEVRTEAVEA